MDYLENYKKMISLRGLTDHTMTSYCTYVTAYLDFVANTLHVQPSEVGYPDIIRSLDSLNEERGLSDRTINYAISQLMVPDPKKGRRKILQALHRCINI